ncbi:3'-5' exonuclease [Ruminococcus bromii]|uniref:ATP-dependent helicase n=1 Tax=Ruminococcus bromii TaxID=40518 RepID=UPI00292FA20D|nr:UvrD-helicase domain-containing protein [Ruminococcus bromii]MDE8727733.1 3'-5' exonuclease [Ruminococcus bromii]
MDKSEILALRRAVLEKDFARMNDRQKQAVFTVNGPLLILAGAGSGKTTVLINRIANILRYGDAYNSTYLRDDLDENDIAACKAYIENGTPLTTETQEHLSVSACAPWRIMAITFTNKAAGELKDRLCAMLGETANDIWASTFHSTCARILRRDGERIGYSSHFTVYDTDDQRRLMKSILKELDISEKNITPKSILNEISRAKDSLISPAEYALTVGDDFRLKIISRAYTTYQKRLEDADAMDFDDLINKVVELFKKCPDVLEYYQNRFRYLMVDEYQDTNHAQYTFVRMLAEKSGNLCVVGDDDQSIYKFRGATIENILSFENTFQNATVIRLEQNYRSTQNILDAANAVIEHNTERKGKTLWTQNGTGAMIHLHTAENETDEAERITKIILDGVAAGRKFSDYAVLYRMNSQSLTFERNFAKSGVPHRIIGGTRFYERREIREMIAYLSVINNPSDEMRLRRIINTPKRSIGDRSVEVAAQIGQQTGETLFEVVSHAKDYPALSRAANKMTLFAAQMQGLIELNNDEEVTLGELYDELVERIDYLNFLKTDDPESAEDRAANVQELASNLRRFEEENPEGTLSDFLEEVSLITDIDNYDNNADSVVLMTVHSAKGLEFPVVFLPGMEENIFPGMASVYVPSEVEEERRLAYVAITRAKEELYIFHAESRMIFGMTNRNRVSRFVEEIPETLVEHTRSRDYSARPVSMPSFGGAKPFGEAPKTKSVAEAGGFTPKPRVKPAPAGIYRVGDTVLHKTFGTGLIVSATPMANDTLLEVAFDKVGTKKLFANFARLTKV